MFTALSIDKIQFEVNLFSIRGTIVAEKCDTFAEANNLMLTSIREAKQTGDKKMVGRILLTINYKDEFGPVNIYHNTLLLCEYDENGQASSINLN